MRHPRSFGWFLEDMMYYTTKFRFLAKPNCKPNLKFSKKARTKTRYETHKTGWYLDFRAVLTPSLKHEIPNLVFNLVSLEKRFGAIVNWVLNVTLHSHADVESLPDVTRDVSQDDDDL